MPPSYKSAISFGLVYVPVTLHVTVKNRDIGFNMLYKKTGERIRYHKTCENCPEQLTSGDIVKGYQYEKGKYVTLTDKEFESLKSEKNKSIEIAQFVKLDEIDPIYFEKSYFVNPTGAEKAFKLILDALRSENKVGVAKTVLGQKEQLVALRAMGSDMILYTMHFYDELQGNPTKSLDEKTTENELKMASQIIDNMTSKFDPKQYKDEYRGRLEKAIKEKIAGKTIRQPKTAKIAKITNLMEALKASVDATAKKPIPKSKRGKKVAS